MLYYFIFNHPTLTVEFMLCWLCRIIKSVDAALQLSHTYRVQVQELGQVLVLFFFSIVVGLIDSTFNDWGLLMKTPDGPSGPFGSADNKDMDVDARGNYNVGRYEHLELLRKTNSLFAIEVLVKLTESRKAMVLLRIVYLNMYGKLFSIQFAF